RDDGVPEHPVVRTYFLDHSDNLRAIAPLEVPEAAGQGAADNASADPRREAWIEICDSRHRFQARLRPAGRERRRRRLLELFDARQQKPLAALLDFADLFRDGAPGGLALGFETRQMLASIDLLYRRLDGARDEADTREPVALTSIAGEALSGIRELS